MMEIDFSLGVYAATAWCIYALGCGYFMYVNLENFDAKPAIRLVCSLLFPLLATVFALPLLLLASWNWFIHGYFDLGGY
jgi:hypothetical protein